MKITYKIDHVNHVRELPLEYSNLSFRRWVDICEVDDPLKRLSILLDIDEKILRKAEIINLEAIIFSLGFLDKSMNIILPSQVMGGYKVPNNLELMQIGRYEDIKVMLDSSKGKKGKEILSSYPEICTITLMPQYIEADKDDQDAFTSKMWELPCEEVLAIGNFTWKKFIEQKLNIPNIFHKRVTLRRKLRLALKNWVRNMAFMLRYYLWKKKLRQVGMNF